MPVKTSRKHSTSPNTSFSKRQSLTYAERWDLSQLAENPVQRFEQESYRPLSSPL